MADGKVAFWCIDEEYRADEDRNLQQTHDPREKACNDDGAAEDMREDDIMRKRRAGEPGSDARSGVLQFIHLGNELKSLEGDEDAQHNTENIQEAGTMIIAPGLYVGDYTHSRKCLVIYKVYKIALNRSMNFCVL